MTKRHHFPRRLVESDCFPIDFLSTLAERESWRKELHRPVYHVHKWWATRLGSVFRGILLGCVLEDKDDLRAEFYRFHNFASVSVFDPFMGSGTTIGEAHKLGMTSLGRDINPVAVQASQTAFGPLDSQRLDEEFKRLSNTVGERVRSLYRSRDSRGRPCDVLYYFWVMQAYCPSCTSAVDLFPSYIIARNAAPRRRHELQVLCPRCGDIFPAHRGQQRLTCRSCEHEFNPELGTAKGKHAECVSCAQRFSIRDAIKLTGARPHFRLYGKLVLTSSGGKAYLAATPDDRQSYSDCSKRLGEAIASSQIDVPKLELRDGYNTRQAMGYGFERWRDFFNDRQLLALGWLKRSIENISDTPTRDALMILFSGVLEFNNLFTSYKGEGTGAVRHMFSHHILKPERTPIEANVWGTPKSSGSFSGMFQTRLMRAINYREAPTEVNGRRGKPRLCSLPFRGTVEPDWPTHDSLHGRRIYLSCGDSATTKLLSDNIDLVVTDPPFFDNVHYSELAVFLHAWQQAGHLEVGSDAQSTRQVEEVQDTNAGRFSYKLGQVFGECARVLKDHGLLVFTYHHSRPDGWESLAAAISQAGFRVVNAHPVRSELSVATPKSQANDPISIDMILVCRKRDSSDWPGATESDAFESARRKVRQLLDAGFELSRNDKRIAFVAQLLTVVREPRELALFGNRVDAEVDQASTTEEHQWAMPRQQTLF